MLRRITDRAWRGHDRGQTLRVEPDGTFSIVALVTRPGHRRPAVVDGVEREERFRLDPTGERVDRSRIT